jgi:hypothetical protein
MEARFEGTLNIKVIRNSVGFLKRVETQNFNTGRRDHEGLNLEGLSRYDFKLKSIFKFLLIFRISFLMQYEFMMSCNMLDLYVPHQKEKLVKYKWQSLSNINGIHIVGGKVALIPVVNSNKIILCNCG